jgi:hypothetical protein
LSRISPLTSLVPFSLVPQPWLAVALQSVQVVPSSQLNRYSKPAAVSVEDGSLGEVSEIVIAEPSFTAAGALKIALGATLSTATVAGYSALSPPSSSRTWPVTLLVPLSLVAQAWLAVSP